MYNTVPPHARVELIWVAYSNTLQVWCDGKLLNVHSMDGMSEKRWSDVEETLRKIFNPR